ncbi:MAG: nucleotide exchange factor GrpE [Bacteroidota bacterium]|nr:nucleotide exchange factor GrpE [Bacteroidota bacterium]MDP4210987.1 nucleotide exchange factor GrpE [Bacteroidota bacterium]MDP4248791.1 nucleotide exchange factor GrpE [Bacteroidota bacterium]
MQKNPENFTDSADPESASERESTVDINTDENVAGTNHMHGETLEPDDVQERFSAELQEQKDKYLRLFAEFDNFKRRTARERLELSQTAGKEIISSLLDVLDDCDRAEKQLQQSPDTDGIREGVLLVFNKLRSILQSKGLRPMVSINTEFDVEKHEAISEIPAPTPKQVGKVIDEVTRGYYLNDKLIRFAKVVVGK